VGGDTTAGPLTLSVSVFGAVPSGQALLRSGARTGDRVCVSGPLGDAAAAVACLQGLWQPDVEDAEYLLQQLYRPTIPLALGRRLLGVASAAIDISDGLLADAGHVARASGVRLNIDPQLLPLSPALAGLEDRESVQRWALAGGDDYQLLFTLPPGLPVPAGATRIGAVVEGEGVDCGMPIDFPPGYQPFGDQP
jgi:thiamine-monophosphate kinase